MRRLPKALESGYCDETSRTCRFKFIVCKSICYSLTVSGCKENRACCGPLLRMMSSKDLLIDYLLA